jgi:hypothetical protein
VLLPRLLDWLCFHFPIRKQAQKVLDAHIENPDIPIECDTMFWPSVKGLILRSRCKEARELLGLHSKIKKSPAIVALRQLLFNIPSMEVSQSEARFSTSVREKPGPKYET